MFLGSVFATYNAFADTAGMNSQDVLTDLAGVQIDGKPFALADYPYNAEGSTELLYFYEYGYSSSLSSFDSFGLYVYVYNPQKLAYKTASALNKITMRVGEQTSYYKYSLTFINMSASGDTAGLFYKFRVQLSSSEFSTLFTSLNSDSRVYEVSEIELYLNGNNAESTPIGQTYTYSGIGSTLACTVVNGATTLSFDVNHTFYRPSGTNGEAYTKDLLYSVYFSIPEDTIEKFGDINKIHATWLGAYTSPIYITSNQTVYNAVCEYLGQYVDGGKYQLVSSANNNTDLKYSLIASKEISSAEFNSASRASSYLSYNENRNFTASDETLYKLAYANFVNDVNETTFISGEALKEWFLDYTDKYGSDTLVAGKYSSDLFEMVDTEFTDIEIAKGDSFNLTDEVVSQDLWQKYIGGGYNVESTTTYEVSAIKEVTKDDFSFYNYDKDKVCNALYIDSNDYGDFLAFCQSAYAKSNRVFLFRYYQASSTSYQVAEYERTKDSALISSFDYAYLSKDAYFCQEWVALDFDILDITFYDGNSYTVIPVAVSPSDAVADTEAPVVWSEQEDLLEEIFKFLQKILIVLCVLIALSLVIKFINYVRRKNMERRVKKLSKESKSRRKRS
jgi:hypothetical protein